MDKILKILLVEDEQAECREITRYIDTLEDVQLVAVTNTVCGALKHVQDYLPDAVILDLELHRGGGNGMQFLQELQIIKPKPFPYILVTTNNTSFITHENTRKLGADFIMVKSQSDYCAESVIDFLRALKNTIHSSQARLTERETEETPDQKRKRLYARVSSEMERIGISPKATGRKYLIDGIIMLYDGLPHNICGTIAQKYTKSDASVERAMQNAITATWRKTDIEDLETFYTARINSARGVPTITEFLHYYADKLKTEY